MSDTVKMDQIGHAMMLAWGRIKKAQARMWGDWMTIGEGLMEGRRWAMARAGTNRPEGKGYAQAFGEWLNRYKVDDIHKADRAKLLQLMEARGQVEEWRAGLTDRERRNLNNPTVAWRKWNASRRPPPDPGFAALAKLNAPRNEPSGINWDPETEAGMRQSLSEAAVENQKLGTEVAELRTRVGTEATIDRATALPLADRGHDPYVAALMAENETLREESAALKAGEATSGMVLDLLKAAHKLMTAANDAAFDAWPMVTPRKRRALERRLDKLTAAIADLVVDVEQEENPDLEDDQPSVPAG